VNQQNQNTSTPLGKVSIRYWVSIHKSLFSHKW
jgi:hypothetical protein